MGRLYERDGKWWLDYVDATGKRVRKAGAKDKSVAQKMLSDAETAAEKVKAGVLHADPREARKPYLSHVSDYISDLRRRGRDGMYVYNVRKHLERAATEQRWANLTMCSQRSVSGYLRRLHDEGLSPKTVNAHRADLSAFFAWCVTQRVMEANPCELVPKSAVKGDKTRRALSVPEIKRLLGAAPEPRRTCYLFLVYTGLRRSEAAALTHGHLHLEVANAHVELPPSLTKSGRAEAVPLVPEVVAALQASRGERSDEDPVFDAIPLMEEFRADLKAAGIEEADGRGRKVVLHSLRHSLATMLVTSSVPMAVAQRIMRHRDIKLTAEVYADEALLPLSAAMSALPSLTRTA
ncbi:MAG TPA: site-specific integrase [Phycisphaerales bacterium]|nr:site-specific integrase [Phycisphaerales bacterium]